MSDIGMSTTEGNRRASGDTLVGDSSQRITVPMPRSLQDLRSAANRHFQGAKQMYHHGKNEVNHPTHMGGIKHNDVIVVAREDMPREAPTMSTHTAHFVQHPIEVRPAPAPKAAPDQSVKFEGSTSYHNDFVKHPMEPRSPAKPAQTMWDNGRRGEAFTGNSTYKQHYPWHEVPRQRPVSRGPRTAEPSPAFDGTTTNKSDYVQHAVRPRSTQAPRERNIDSGPFEGSTTYALDYQKHAMARSPKPVGHRPALQVEKTPFEGSTEYGREYLKHQFEARQMVHIEPEIRRPKSRGRSAPSTNRRGRSTPKS